MAGGFDGISIRFTDYCAELESPVMRGLDCRTNARHELFGPKRERPRNETCLFE
jgi:hypothetical protein